MSVIAYDGRIIAADRQCTQYNMARADCKLIRHGSVVLGWVGDLNMCYMMRDWYMAGADPDEWMEDVAKDEETNSTLIVATRDKLWTYRQFPVAIGLAEPPWAWGSGYELAVGAMAAGMDARAAVELTCERHVYCGMGVDAYVLADLPKVQTAEDRARAKAKGRRGKAKN